MTQGRSIQFKNLEVGPTKTELAISSGTQEYSVFFEFDRVIQPTNSEIAHALSTLCGKKYKQIGFSFEVPRNTVAEIEKFTGAEVSAFASDSVVLPKYESGSVLSFSGGFDSMAAKALMPDDTHLVSIDFGGWFKRETDFFRRFSPITVTTNVRRVPDHQTSFARNHWGFMAIGAILTRSYLKAKYHTFGTILGSEFAAPGPSRVKLQPLESLGFVDAPYTNGITELGTAKLMTMAYPRLLGESLDSLAGKKDRKRLLKIALIHGVAKDLESLPGLPPVVEEWSTPVSFDSSYTTALAALSLWSKDRGHLISPLFHSVPSETIEFARSIDFSFMGKVNWDKHQHMDKELLGDFWDKLSTFGFTPYTEADWENVKKVRAHLNAIFN